MELTDMVFSAIEQMGFLSIAQRYSFDVALALYEFRTSPGIDWAQLPAPVLYYDIGRAAMFPLESATVASGAVLPAQGPLRREGSEWPTLVSCRADVQDYAAFAYYQAWLVSIDGGMQERTPGWLANNPVEPTAATNIEEGGNVAVAVATPVTNEATAPMGTNETVAAAPSQSAMQTNETAETDANTTGAAVVDKVAEKDSGMAAATMVPRRWLRVKNMR